MCTGFLLSSSLLGCISKAILRCFHYVPHSAAYLHGFLVCSCYSQIMSFGWHLKFRLPYGICWLLFLTCLAPQSSRHYASYGSVSFLQCMISGVFARDFSITSALDNCSSVTILRYILSTIGKKIIITNNNTINLFSLCTIKWDNIIIY